MKIRAKTRFYNDNFRQARLKAGFPTLRSLSVFTEINYVTIGSYETLRDYPKKTEIISKLETALLKTFDELFPPECIVIVQRKQGKPIERVQEMSYESICSNFYNQKFFPAAQEENIFKEDLKKVCRELIESNILREQEKQIMEMIFMKGIKMSKVAEKFNCTRERIRQIMIIALKKIRTNLIIDPEKSEELREYLKR